jgi:nitrate reductase gamma subunit
LHLAGLLFPRQITAWDLSPTRLYLLEGAAFALGLGTLAGWARLMWRQLGRASDDSVAGQLADAAFLSMAFVALLSGLLTAALCRWGSSWGVATLTPYVWSVLRGNPLAAIAAGLPFVVRVHVFSSIAGLAMVPYTRLAPLVVAPVRRAVTLLMRPVSAAARSVQGALELAFQRNNPLPRIWPEED